MLGKLLKHEFRATGRIMLPVFGVLLILSMLFNVSVRLSGKIDFPLLRIFFGLVGVAFVVGIIAAELLSLILMIYRFYRNMLGDEGYLMFTLPTDVHALVWSKLIVSFVWLLLTNLLILLIMFFTAFSFSQTGLQEVFRQLPSWAETRQMLAELGISVGMLTGLALEGLLILLLAGLTVCLHFYASMSLGHMFSRRKILWSVLFFVGISFTFRFLLSGLFLLLIPALDQGRLQVLFTDGAGLTDIIRVMMLIMGAGGLVSLAESVILYLATTLSLQKRLNLA